MGNWQAWNDGTGKRKWFLARVVDGITEYYWSSTGVLVRYARYETALQSAKRLDDMPTLVES